MSNVEREQLQQQSVQWWERERHARVDAYAAALTHLNAAAAALPADTEAAGRMILHDVWRAADTARGRIRAVLNEPNPFVGRRHTMNDPASGSKHA
jgi:hypothetical protein